MKLYLLAASALTLGLAGGCGSGGDGSSEGDCPEGLYCLYESPEELCADVVVDFIEGEMDTTVGEFWYDDRQRLDDGVARIEDVCREWYQRRYGD